MRAENHIHPLKLALGGGIVSVSFSNAVTKRGAATTATATRRSNEMKGSEMRQSERASARTNEKHHWHITINRRSIQEPVDLQRPSFYRLRMFDFPPLDLFVNFGVSCTCCCCCDVVVDVVVFAEFVSALTKELRARGGAHYTLFAVPPPHHHHHHHQHQLTEFQCEKSL